MPWKIFQLYENTPLTAMVDIQGDISHICQHGWYERCYFLEESNIRFLFQKQQLGRVIGPVKNKFNKMTQDVLTITGKVVP